MGDKLGKMVRIVFLIIPLLLIFEVEANIPNNEDSKKPEIISKLHLNKLSNNARIFELVGDGKSFSIKRTSINKPTKKILKYSNLVTKRDKYVLNFVDENNKSLIKIGIGDPFTAYAQHLGYEQSSVYSFQVGNQNIKTAIPIELNPAQMIVEKRSSLDTFTEISRITLDIK